MINSKLILSLLISLCLIACVPTGLKPSNSGPQGQVLSNCVICSANTPLYNYSMIRKYIDWTKTPVKVYTEKIWVKKDGSYHIECLNVATLNGGPVSSAEVLRYQQSLHGGMGFFAVYKRGFQINNTEQFLDNYFFSILGMNMPYLQRKALAVEVRSKVQDRPNYFLMIDQETGLVLKSVESSVAAPCLSVMEVTEFTLNPDFTGISFKDPDLYKGEYLAPNAIKNEFSFPTYQPAYLPTGFVLASTTKGVIRRPNQGDIKYLKQLYRDGVQELSIVQYLRLDAKKSQKGMSPTQVKNNVLLGNSSYVGKRATHFYVNTVQFSVNGNIDIGEMAVMLESLRMIK